MSEQCFCLRWNNYQTSVMGVMKSLLEEEQFVDVTIACDGKRIKAHKLMLSACSNFFKEIFKDNPNEHPIVFLRDVRFWELEAILDFIYNGQVNVMQKQLPGFIRTAEALQIKGLAAVNNNSNNNNNNNNIYSSKMTDMKFSPEIQRLHDMYMRQQEMEIEETLQKANDPVSYLPSIPYGRGFNPLQMSLNKNLKYDSRERSPLRGSLDHGKKVPELSHSTPKHSSDTIVKINNGDVITPTKKNNHDNPSDISDTNSENGISGKVSVTLSAGEKMKEELEGDPQPDGNSDGEHSSNEGSLIMADNPKESDWVGVSSMPIFGEEGVPVCKICGKVFKHQGSLVAHYQVHQQRTKCPVCKKVLSRHYHMKVHLLTVHKVPDAEIEGLLRSQNIV